MSKTPLIKVKNSNFPISDYIRVVVMLLVVFLTFFAIKIGGFFTGDKGRIRVIESPQLSETGHYVQEEAEIIKKMPD